MIQIVKVIQSLFLETKVSNLSCFTPVSSVWLNLIKFVLLKFHMTSRKSVHNKINMIVTCWLTMCKPLCCDETFLISVSEIQLQFVYINLHEKKNKLFRGRDYVNLAVAFTYWNYSSLWCFTQQIIYDFF